MHSDDFVYYIEQDKNSNKTNIVSGGFNVSDIIQDISPVVTLNNQEMVSPNMIGGGNDVHNLVVPSWIFSKNYKKASYETTNIFDCDYIDDSLHDKLISLISSHKNIKTKSKKKREKTKEKNNKTKKRL